MRRIPHSVVLLCLPLLAACGRGGSGADEGYPPPGEMRVVSVERIEDSPGTQSLIPNGDFSQWWAGAPVPNGFVPPAEQDSIIEREQLGERHVLLQRWKNSNGSANLVEMLRVESMPLKKGRRYELQVTAVAPAGRAASLSLWQQNDAAQWQPMAHNFLTLQPAAAGVKTYTKGFIADRDGPIAIASTAVGEISEDNAAVWLEWQLVETAT